MCTLLVESDLYTRLISRDSAVPPPPKREPYRKVLYLKQHGYPDNYVDSSFLSDLQRNGGSRASGHSLAQSTSLILIQRSQRSPCISISFTLSDTTYNSTSRLHFPVHLNLRLLIPWLACTTSSARSIGSVRPRLQNLVSYYRVGRGRSSAELEGPAAFRKTETTELESIFVVVDRRTAHPAVHTLSTVTCSQDTDKGDYFRFDLGALGHAFLHQSVPRRLSSDSTNLSASTSGSSTT